MTQTLLEQVNVLYKPSSETEEIHGLLLTLMEPGKTYSEGILLDWLRIYLNITSKELRSIELRSILPEIGAVNRGIVGWKIPWLK
jgi:hypothetical protein